MSQQFRTFPKPESQSAPPQRSFRPNYGGMRQRELAKQEEERKKKEDSQKKSLENTEANFPSLSAPATTMRCWSGDESFAGLAKDWKQADEDAKAREEYRKKHAEEDARMNGGVISLTKILKTKQHEVAPAEDTYTRPTDGPDEDGWSTVKNTRTRNKKQSTDADMERFYAQTIAEEEVEDDINGHLTDSFHRREFY